MMMEKIIITENESNQRLDRFLKKYLKNAPLSYIYKAIRKDVKLNGKRAGMDSTLSVGDEVALYISHDELSSFVRRGSAAKIKRQFRIAYEDENLLIVEKPFGLLTHGDKLEKKNTLGNQVIAYLADKGDYKPGSLNTFVPAPVNRLDRNTTGLVIFGKNYVALRVLNQMIRERSQIRKFYLTIVKGIIENGLTLRDMMLKDHRNNTARVMRGASGSEVGVSASGSGADVGADIRVVDRSAPNKKSASALQGKSGNSVSADPDDQKLMETIAKPVMSRNGFTLVEAELITGRTHQIRVQLAEAGYPVIGDPKYGNESVNARMNRDFGLSTQFLHAYKLVFGEIDGELAYLTGLIVEAPLPEYMDSIKTSIFDGSRIGRSRYGSKNPKRMG